MNILMIFGGERVSKIVAFYTALYLSKKRLNDIIFHERGLLYDVVDLKG